MFYNFFIIYKKWITWLIIKKNRDVILNRAKDYKNYYENEKERLRDTAKGKYRNLSEEEKNEKNNMEKADINIVCLKKRNKN